MANTEHAFLLNQEGFGILDRVILHSDFNKIYASVE